MGTGRLSILSNGSFFSLLLGAHEIGYTTKHSSTTSLGWLTFVIGGILMWRLPQGCEEEGWEDCRGSKEGCTRKSQKRRQKRRERRFPTKQRRTLRTWRKMSREKGSSSLTETNEFGDKIKKFGSGLCPRQTQGQPALYRVGGLFDSNEEPDNVRSRSN